MPYKVACFVWLLSKEAVLTEDNLMKRGLNLTSRSVFCGGQTETVAHLFLHCKITRQLWRLFLSLKGISWTMPGRVTETLQSWEEVGMQAKDKRKWRIIPATIWWTIRKERNFRVFKNIENSIEQVELNCILTLCFWCKQIWSNDPVSIIDVLGSL
ncbi:unnamed protein product [Withania somnifera]